VPADIRDGRQSHARRTVHSVMAVPRVFGRPTRPPREHLLAKVAAGQYSQPWTRREQKAPRHPQNEAAGTESLTEDDAQRACGRRPDAPKHGSAWARQGRRRTREQPPRHALPARRTPGEALAELITSRPGSERFPPGGPPGHRARVTRHRADRDQDSRRPFEMHLTERYCAAFPGSKVGPSTKFKLPCRHR